MLATLQNKKALWYCISHPRHNLSLAEAEKQEGDTD